jgi:hypothetical protein
VTDVYAAGFEKNQAGLEIAKYWKNGQPVVLGAGTYSSSATSIAVSGSDVYAVGVEGNGTTDIAKYWKNGVPVELTDGTKTGRVHSIFVSGGDVYVAGEEHTIGYGVAEYWKNGVPVILTDNTNPAEAWSIFVSGSDVYVAGYEYKTTQIDPTHSVTNPVAKYWKNGVPVELTNGLNAAIAYSIFVSGTDLYVAGYACQTMTPDCPRATYWKNGVPVQLTNIPASTASSIAVSGHDVYISQDRTNDTSELWKNGNSSQLTNSVSANQVVVSGSDVYVCGAMVDGSEFAAYWKNGTPVRLTDGQNDASAFALAVVKH